MSRSSLIEHFGALEDPRQGKVLFPLPEVLLLVLCGTLAGAEDFVAIRRRGKMHAEFLRRLLPFKAGIPGHDTLNDVLNAIDGALFAQCRGQDEWAVQRRYMSLETLAPISDVPTVNLPAVAALTAAQPRSGTQRAPTTRLGTRPCRLSTGGAAPSPPP